MEKVRKETRRLRKDNRKLIKKELANILSTTLQKAVSDLGLNSKKITKIINKASKQLAKKISGKADGEKVEHTINRGDVNHMRGEMKRSSASMVNKPLSEVSTKTETAKRKNNDTSRPKGNRIENDEAEKHKKVEIEPATSE